MTTLKSHIFAVRDFRENKFSREFIFAKRRKFAKFAKLSSHQIFKKQVILEIRENLFPRNILKETVPRNSRKFAKTSPRGIPLILWPREIRQHLFLRNFQKESRTRRIFQDVIRENKFPRIFVPAKISHRENMRL